MHNGQSAASGSQFETLSEAYRARLGLCRSIGDKNACREHSVDQCLWSDEKNSCVAGSVNQCEMLSKKSCVEQKDCGYFDHDDICVPQIILSKLSENLQSVQNAKQKTTPS